MSTTITRSEPRVVSVSGAFTSHLHPTPSWQLTDHTVPTGREENWRFTPVKRFKPLMTDGPFGQISVTTTLPEGVTSRTIDAAAAKDLSFDPPVDLVAAKAVQAEQALLIEVAPQAVLDAPVVITTDGSDELAASHMIITVGHHAEATIVLQRTGVSRLASKVEVQVDEGARVDVITVQDWATGAVHGGQYSIRIGRDAKVRSFQATIGQGDVRLVERVEYAGPGGELNQLGIYFVQSEQHVEHRLLVDHNHPNTVSLVDYRGALQGAGAHSVWIGDALIRKTVVDINTYETNKNLMLTEGCRADSVPNLEIETGEIRGAGHSSSTGRFDANQLFYLRSRGIPEEQARRLIVEGFFFDIIRRIGLPEIEARLVEALNVQLASIEDLSHDALLSEDDQA
ncbi:MAG: SufD family Fe-S cluster assembly protein [Propionibacterium sp.]|nr:SufD family Fe-S cluster assembly protein [Propionibacterium sp.]